MTGAVCAVAGWICVQESLRQFSYHTTTAMGLDIPKVWVSSFIAYAMISAALYFLRHAFSRSTPSATADTRKDPESWNGIPLWAWPSPC